MAHQHQISIANNAFQSMPCTKENQAATFPTVGAGPWGAAAAPVGGSPGSQAAGATQVHLDGAKLSPFVFLLSIPLLCSPENCVFQVQIPDLGPRSTPSSEWVFRNNGLFFFIVVVVVVVVTIIITI